jgi:hypothetical protein
MHDKMLNQTPIIVTIYCVSYSETISFIRLINQCEFKDIIKSKLLNYVYLIRTNIDLPSILERLYILDISSKAFNNTT